MRARVLAIAVVLGAGAAWGDWYGESITGLPRDVTILDGGRFIAVSSTETVQFICDAGSCSRVITDAGVVIGAFADSTGCTSGITSTGAINGCGNSGNVGGFAGTARSLMCLPNSSCLLAGVNVLAVYATNLGPPQTGTSWTASGSTGAGAMIVPPLGGVSIGTTDWFAMGTSNGPILVVDGGRSGAFIAGVGNNPNAVALFERPDGKVGIIAASGDFAGLGERYGADLTLGGDAGWLPAPIVFEGNQTGGLKHLAYSELSGSAFGRGIGMGTQRDGGVMLSSPVPNPNAPGMLWRVRVGQLPGIAKRLIAVRCADGVFCAGVADDTVAPNVFYWFNEGGSTGDIRILGGARPLAEGSTLDLAVVQSEADSDPVWVTWLNDGGVISIGGSDGGIFATATGLPNPGGACSSQLQVSAVVSDGLAIHDAVVFIDGGLTYQRTTPDSVMVTPTLSRVDAGGASVVLTAMPLGLCPGTPVWRLTPDAGTLTVTDGGLSATYTSPSHFCDADGGVVIEARGQLDGGLSSRATVSVQVVPWGAPNTPAFDAGAFTQLAGTSRTYGFAAPTHVCEGAMLFPGVTVRVLDAGTDASVVVTGALGGVTIDSLEECLGGTVNPQVSFELNGSSSPPADFTVTLIPDIQPLVNPPFSMNLQVDAGGAVLHGFFFVDGGCISQRALTADVTVAGFTTPRFIAPGPWSTGVPGSCNGGTYMAVARLYEGGGLVTTEASMPFNGVVQPAGVGVLDQAELTVSCDGVDSTLTVGDDGCPLAATAVTWTQLSGPAVEPLANAAAVRVRSVARALDGLIGETLTFDIESNAGGGNTARGTRSIRLVPLRFVTVAHRMTPAAPSSDDVVTVSVEVHNTGTCRVSGVMLEETPAGLRFIAGSARVDGEAVDAGGLPSIGPFELEAGQTRTVRWLGKPTRLSTPRARGAAFVAGLPISQPEPEPLEPTGCGCQSAPFIAVALAALSMLRRRRF